MFKGFSGGYGGAGLSLGPRYGNGAKGPMKGSRFCWAKTNILTVFVFSYTAQIDCVNILGYSASAGVSQGSQSNVK